MTNEENEQYLFECYIAELRRWRYMKCNQMLETINAMLLAELHKRIMGDKNV